MAKKKKKQNQSLKKWLAKNRNPVIGALIIAIIAGLIVAFTTGFSSLIWNELFGNDNDSGISFVKNDFYSNIEFNISTKIPDFPIVYEIEESEKWDAFLERGKELIDNDSCNTAIDFLKQMENQYSNNALYFHIISSAYTELDEFIIALEYINKSIEIDNRREWAFFLRSSLYNTDENIEKAIDDIKIAIYLNRKNPTVWILYGITMLKKWDVETAKQFADSALHYNASPNQYYVLKRLISIVSQDFEKALAYDDSLELGRNFGITNPLEFETRARIYAWNNKYPEALAFIDSCLYIDNNNAAVWELKALIYLRIGYLIPDSRGKANVDSLNYIFRQAMNAADSAIYYQKDINNTKSIFYKGVSLMLLGYPKKAIPYFEILIKKDSSNSNALKALNHANEVKDNIFPDRAVLDNEK